MAMNENNQPGKSP